MIYCTAALTSFSDSISYITFLFLEWRIATEENTFWNFSQQKFETNAILWISRMTHSNRNLPRYRKRWVRWCLLISISVLPTSPWIMSVQYTRGCSVYRGYHEYSGRISWVHQGIFCTGDGCSSTLGGGHSVHRGDYYEYTEGIPYKKGLQVLKRPW